MGEITLTRENTEYHQDAGKSRVDLIPILATEELGRVMGYGAEKYGVNNWTQHAGRWAWTQLTASALRHIYVWMRGEDNDPESGLNHLAHALANLAMLLDLVLLKQGEDDRNPVYSEGYGLPMPEWTLSQIDTLYVDLLHDDTK